MKNNKIIIVGCPCHILYNASEKAGSSFSDEVGFDIEDHCVDLFYWFDKSSKSQSILKEYNELCDEEYADIIQNISTRLLCLEKCVSRELDKFEGIKSYFVSEKFSDQRFKRLKTYFKDPMTSVYLRFYQSTLPVFNNFNKMLQSEEPLIYVMHDHQQKLMVKLASKFIKPEIIQISYSNISEIDISRHSQKEDEDLSVGLLTDALLTHLLDEGSITDHQVNKFYSGVRAFFTTAFNYCFVTGSK